MPVINILGPRIPTFSPIAPIAHATSPNGGANSSVTPARDTTGAKGLYVGVGFIGTVSPVITDFYNNTWVPLTAQSAGAGSTSVQIFYCANPIVGPGHTFTETLTGAQGTIAMLALSNTLNAVVDQQNGTSNTGLTTTTQTGNLTPTQPNSVIVTALAYYSLTTNAATIDSGFTIGDQPQANATVISICMAYKIQTTALLVNPLWGDVNAVTLPMEATIASFKHA